MVSVSMPFVFHFVESYFSGHQPEVNSIHPHITHSIKILVGYM